MKKKIQLASHFLDRITAKEFAAFCLIIIVSISYIPLPIIIRDILKELQGADIDLNYLIGQSGILISIFILQFIITILSRKVLVQFIRTSVLKLRKNLLRKYLFATEHPAGESISSVHKKIFTDTEMLDRLFNSLLINILPSVCITVIAFLMMIYINWLLMLAVITLTALVMVVLKFVKNKRDSITAKYYKNYSLFNNLVLFIIRFRELIHVQSMKNQESQNINTRLESLKSDGVEMEMAYTRATGVQELGQSTILVVILIVSAFLKNEGKIEIEAVFAVFFLIYVVRRQLLLITLHAQNVTEGFISLNKLKSLENKLDKRVKFIKSGSTKKIVFKGSVVFDKVSFSYDRQIDLLKEVSFSLLPNKINLLQGANGAGKSTIMKLILGYWQPDSGTIFIEGVTTEELDFPDFITQTGVVLQENELFEGTIEENLLYGVSKSRDDLNLILDQVGLQNWVDRLPLKLKTPLSDLSDKISGGEKQRLSIARALIKCPGLLILDEPTNHLDITFLRQIAAIFSKLKERMTLLIISHDKSLEEIADQILLLEDCNVKVR